MEKRISYSQFQSVKCVAKACDPLITKRNKLKDRIEKLAAEYKDCDTQINSFQEGIVKVIGLPVEKLVKKVMESGVDVNGQPKKTTKYLPTDIVAYDEKHKQYIITIPEAEEKVSEEETSNKEAETTDAVNAAADECNDPVDNAPTEVEETTDTVSEAPVENTDNVPTDAPIFG